MIRNGRITWNTSSQHRAAVGAVLHYQQSHQQHSGTDNISLLQRKLGWLNVPVYYPYFCVLVCQPWCTADAQKWRLGSGGSETHRSTLPGCTWLTIQRPRQGCVLRMMQCYNFTKLYTLIPNKTGGWSILLGGGGWDWIVYRRQDGWWWMRRGCTADGARPQRKQSPRQAAPTTFSTLSSQYSQNRWVIECLPALLWFWWVTVTIAVHRVDNIMIP